MIVGPTQFPLGCSGTLGFLPSNNSLAPSDTDEPIKSLTF